MFENDIFEMQIIFVQADKENKASGVEVSNKSFDNLKINSFDLDLQCKGCHFHSLIIKFEYGRKKCK